jgi:hypothetical protein
MTQSYYSGSEFDAFQRPNHRTMSNGSYYDRAGPYNYYEPRHELRQEYAARVPTHTIIQEQEQPESGGVHARRRIAVAVSVLPSSC